MTERPYPPERCDAWMRQAKERCGRRKGHLTEHRTTAAMEHNYRMQRGHDRPAYLP